MTPSLLRLQLDPVAMDAPAVADPLRRATTRLKSRLRRASDPDPQLLDFLEDDLREGASSLGELERFFDDVVEALLNPETRAAQWVDLADDPEVLDRLEALSESVGSIRRRLGQLAARR